MSTFSDRANWWWERVDGFEKLRDAHNNEDPEFDGEKVVGVILAALETAAKDLTLIFNSLDKEHIS